MIRNDLLVLVWFTYPHFNRLSAGYWHVDGYRSEDAVLECPSEGVWFWPSGVFASWGRHITSSYAGGLSSRPCCIRLGGSGDED
ncbi:hypothetical protein JAAARDRAFT_188785 [Jaapia argillacea MUCL 33604]|uniref:Uncharacterized protein n=1 Tax=Jaapia argillacea MUCL 33604 TaxID=933084 RepID=A0A067Q878_9AGAM|nr:hypothetical protein JAAARDRAFT_188785 [Jaapia argillacea MUCL 33604]